MMKSYPTRSSLQALVALLLLSVLAACNSTGGATKPVDMNYDKQFNFANVHSLYIEPFSRTDAATITTSDGQIERINAALTAELQRKGFVVVADSARADLFISWYLITEDEVYAAPGACPGCDRPADSDSLRYAKGTLIVDMVDPMRNQPVWRATLHTQLTGQPGTAQADQARQKAAAELFAQFPPPAGS